LVICFLASSWAGAQSVPSVALLPASPTTLDRVQLTITGWDLLCCPPAFDQPPQVSGSTIRVDGASRQCPPVPGCSTIPPETWSRQVLVGPLAAGDYFLHVFLDQTLLVSSRFEVVPAALEAELFLGQERFRVDVDWQDAAGGGSGYAKPLSDESGYFWFFEPGNVELTVKVLDGRAINGHFWVFIASMTDVGFTMVVTDTANQGFCPLTGPTSCPTRTYVNPPSKNQNFIDVTAF
jgi:hypothetical protein